MNDRIFSNLRRYFQKILYKNINILNFIMHFKNTNVNEKNNKIIDRKKIYKIFNQHLKWLENNNTGEYVDLQNIILVILIYLILIYTILFSINHI